MDIGSLVDRAGIALEQKALETFGAAIETFKRGAQGLGVPFIEDKPSNPFESNGQVLGKPSYSSASYAAALAGGTNWRPKLKFLFKVEFFFTMEAKELISSLTGASINELDSNEFTFMVKTVDRPKIDFEYEDDVNMYNFRTKALKRIRHRELTMTFMDDTGNRVVNFFHNIMLVYSPITRRSLNRANQYSKPDAFMLNEPGSGMIFSSPSEGANSNDLSHRGVINSPVGNAIESIRIKQMFTDLSAVPSESLKQVCFDFVNPRIISFDLDDLSHETSEVNLLTLQFDYDWLEVVDNTITEQSQNSPVFNGVAPGVNDVPADVSPSKNSTQTSPGKNSPYKQGTNSTTATPDNILMGLIGSDNGANSPLNGVTKTSNLQPLQTVNNQASARPSRLPIFDSTMSTLVPADVTSGDSFFF